jgi:serine/threonine protein kinase
MTILHPSFAKITNSIVYKATGSKTELSDSVRIAIKCVPLEDGAKFVEMIVQEHEILTKLGSVHNHILPMLQRAEREQEVIILFPFAPDGDLAKLVNIGVDCVEELEVRRLSLQVLSALTYIHGQSIIHGDVAPQNLLLTKVVESNAFLVQVCDFGLSVVVPDGQKAVTVSGVQGTYGYIPQEVKLQKPITYAVDLFALGVIAFRLLGGHDPFYPPSDVEAPIEFDCACWSPVSVVAREYVTQLLAVEPGVRGTSSVDAHPWLQLPEEHLMSPEPRRPLAPTPVPGIHFGIPDDCASNPLEPKPHFPTCPIPEQGLGA